MRMIIFAGFCCSNVIVLYNRPLIYNKVIEGLAMQNKSYEEVSAELLSEAIKHYPNTFQKSPSSTATEVAEEIASAYKVIFKAVMSSRRNQES
jgi:hypothetical protein